MLKLPKIDDQLEACRAMPLFPLPEMTLLPNTLIRLHIFEPRYVQLLKDTMDDRGIIAMPMLDPNANLENGEPKLVPTAGFGLIAACEPLPDDRYAVALLGLGRLRIIEELPQEKLYRIAHTERLTREALSKKDWRSIHHRICTLLSQLIIQNPKLTGLFSPLLSLEGPAELMLNSLAHILLNSSESRQTYLEESNLIDAAALIEDALTQALLEGQIIEE